jgi:hypothetical protein
MVLSVIVVEEAVCEVTPCGRPLSWKFTVPRKPVSGSPAVTTIEVLVHRKLEEEDVR